MKDLTYTQKRGNSSASAGRTFYRCGTSQSVENVDDGKYPGFVRDLLAAQAERISGTVEPLVVARHHGRSIVENAGLGDHFDSVLS
jgi:hypothetical protein